MMTDMSGIREIEMNNFHFLVTGNGLSACMEGCKKKRLEEKISWKTFFTFSQSYIHLSAASVTKKTMGSRRSRGS